MTGLLPVEFLDTAGITFAAHPPPALTPRERVEVDRLWQETRAGNPAAFDGPIAAALGVDRPRAGELVVRWAPATYRMRALRRLRPPGRVPGSLYVTALVPTEGGILIGRGSPGTAHPGCWTLPGGTVEPPPPGEDLDIAGLRRHAVRELLEETGTRLPAGELRLWALTRSRRFGSLGFHFACPAAAEALVRRRHATLAGTRTAPAPETPPELDALAFVTSPDEATDLGPTTDYLPQLLGRYFDSR
ncbi:NUDIX hydrolase [Streptomyces filamentosus]|uniref:NUDIX hydrolase n=1 Tax=Streptomyces filamentosus TaxID=67294 RepID=UPI0037D56F3D